MFNRYKIVTVITTILILMLFFTNSFSKVSANTTHLNDLNNDSKVDILDVIELIRKLFNSNYTFLNSNSNPDINKDGVFSTLDVLALIRLISETELTPTISPNTTVRVMSWNVGNWVPGGGVAETSEELAQSIALQTARMHRLGDIIKNEKAEIVFIQEINNKDPNPKLNAKIKHYDVLMEHLKNIGWEMYGDIQPYKSTPDELYLFILSRYPLDANTKQFMYGIKTYNRRADGSVYSVDARAAQSIVVKNTPIGDFRLSNYHTHNKVPCRNMKTFIDFYKQFDPTTTLLGGDANLILLEKPNIHSRDLDDCESVNWNEVDISCTEKPCLANMSYDEFGPPIDWFFRFPNSKLYIKSMYNMAKDSPRAAGVADWHPFVMAEVGIK